MAEIEYNQAWNSLVSSLNTSTLFEKYPEYRRALPLLSVPERIIQFRVVWEGDDFQPHVNHGYRIQFSSCLGPFRGGTRFHPSVNLSVLKFLSLEMTMKNALTGLSLGGAKGGSDFDPKAKSDREIHRFCTAYMRELSRHIGANVDIVAGDVGVSPREVGWLFGSYKQQSGFWEGAVTSKGLGFGGSEMKLPSTGYGLIRTVSRMIDFASQGRETLEGKRIAISGCGNVAQYAALKAIELGAIVISLSDSCGTVISTSDKGFSEEQMAKIIALKKARKQLADFVISKDLEQRFQYHHEQRPWQHVGEVAIVLPCATQNELSLADAKALVAAGCRFIAEGSNMGCSKEAIELFETLRTSHKTDRLWAAPGKLANIGGTVVSALEMAQNSQRTSWTAQKVESELNRVIDDCFDRVISVANEYGEQTGPHELPNLFLGSDVASFLRVATAMRDQGEWW